MWAVVKIVAVIVVAFIIVFTIIDYFTRNKN